MTITETLPEVLPPSFMSLYVETFFNGTSLGTGTAFIVEHRENFFLITNRHVVRGRDNNTDEPLSKTAGIPNELRIYFNEANKLGSWLLAGIDLYRNWPDETTFVWKEHPVLKNKADIVAFKIEKSDKIDLYPYNLESSFNIKIQPSDYLSVIGFPFGKRAHGYLAIWTTGFLATDFDLNYDDLPVFLIDSRTRSGQSGSPVIVHRNSGMYINTQGSTSVSTGVHSKLLGVYSGRINKESDLGYVWKLSAIKELLESF
jgi:S1-C subfamily serine protease